MSRITPLEPEHYGMVRPYQKEIDLGDAESPKLNAVAIAGTESEWIDCSAKYAIVISPELSASNVTAKIRVVLGDANTPPGRVYSEEIQIENTGEQDDIRVPTYFHGRGEQCFTFGANRYKILLSEAPANGGFLTVYTAEV